MVLFLVACAAPTPPGKPSLAGTALISDLRGNAWSFVDVETGERNDYSLAEAEPGVCEGADQDPYCLLFQSQVHEGFDGRSEVIFSYSPLDSSDGSDAEVDDLIGRVRAVDAVDHSPRWGVDWLDFSAISDTACPYDPLDPCHPPASLSVAETFRCRLHMPHDIAIVEEDDASIHFWIADARNARMLELTAPRDGDCAVVNTVLDRRLPDWDIYTSPNSVDYSETDGVESLLFTVKGSVADTPEGMAQLAGADRGKLLYWENAGSGWSQVWEFPPESTDMASFVNAPHGAVRATLDDGTDVAMFAESLGAADDFGVGSGGSVVVVRMDDDGPVYLYDALHAGAEPWHFPRDVTPLSGGRFLISDSGCLGPECTVAGAAWVVRFGGAEPTGVSGAWSIDGSDEVRIPLDADVGPLFDDFTMIYSAQWIAP